MTTGEISGLRSRPAGSLGSLRDLIQGTSTHSYEEWPPVGGQSTGPLLTVSSAEEDDWWIRGYPMMSDVAATALVWPFALAFLDSVSHLPHVRMIILEHGGPDEEPQIWTIISAPPFDSTYRRPIYEAQAEVLRRGDYPVAGFRLINVDELQRELSSVLPERYDIVFEREPQ